MSKKKESKAKVAKPAKAKVAKPAKAKVAKAAKAAIPKEGELPDYIKNKIWLKAYPKDVSAEVKVPKDKSIVDMFDEAVAKDPDFVNLIYYGTQLPRKVIKDQVDRLATAFQQKLGVKKGDKIAIYLPNCPQFYIAYYAGLKAGAVMTCVNPQFVPRELGYQLKDSGAQTLVTMDMFYPRVTDNEVKKDVKLKNVILCNIMGQPVSVPENTAQGIYHMGNLIKDTAPNVTKVKIDPMKDIAVIQYTGGVTGLPKGALLTHYNIVSDAYQTSIPAIAQMKRFKEDKIRAISILPWSHIYGQTCELVMGQFVPLTMMAFAQFNPDLVLDAINKFKPWSFLGVTALLVALMNNPKAKETDFSSVKYMSMGAASTPDAIALQWKKISGHPLSEGYGLTEASPVTHTRMAELFGEKLGSIGPPIPNTLAGIVDPETNKWLPIGEMGEMVISGDQVMQGYWNKPEENKKVFFQAGGLKWLKTGDLAKMDKEGYFFIVDRAKDIIKYKGHSVYPRELEEVLFTHPAVMEAAVIGIPDPEAGENIKAFVVLKPDYKGKVKEKEIQDWMKEKVAAYKYPRYVEFVDTLPKTLVGKILRRVLREQDATKKKK